MFTIGDFATLGRVSVRMLRHYDAAGLLRPARVDAWTGYRYYSADQLGRLNRLIALKELGFKLSEIAKILDADVDATELRGMLRLRQSQVAAQIAADRDRLVRIEARLRIIEKEGVMSTNAVTVKSTEAVRVASLSDIATGEDYAQVGPVISSLFPRLYKTVCGAGVQPAGSGIAFYTPEGDGLRVSAACPIPPQADPGGVEVTELASVPEAACYVHEGEMDSIGEAYQVLAAWIDDNGYRTDGTAREVYLVSYPEPASSWKTELQMPITRS